MESVSEVKANVEVGDIVGIYHPDVSQTPEYPMPIRIAKVPV